MTGPNTLYWCFTINNPESNDLPASMLEAAEYAVWQRERGGAGTEHLQGYVVFRVKKRLSWLKRNVDQRAHFEGRRGSHEQAKEYCTKEETRVAGPWSHGLEPTNERGKRNDLVEFKARLDEGWDEARLAQDDDYFPVWAKHYKIVSRYHTLSARQRDWPVYTHVIWGPPGVGKTRAVRELAGPGAFWVSRPAGQTVWFDGYIGQDTLVIDEFYGWMSLSLLCRLLDRYPLNVETKGGSVPMLCKKVFITSNTWPRDWYPKQPVERTAALQRRLEGDLGRVEYMGHARVDGGAEPAPALRRRSRSPDRGNAPEPLPAGVLEVFDNPGWLFRDSDVIDVIRGSPAL